MLLMVLDQGKAETEEIAVLVPFRVWPNLLRIFPAIHAPRTTCLQRQHSKQNQRCNESGKKQTPETDVSFGVRPWHFFSKVTVWV
jgi:hypothetical protein